MVAVLDPEQRLPLIEGAFPALRQRSAEELRSLVAVVEEIGSLELLRAVCASLHCPVPPLAAPQRKNQARAGRTDAA